MRKLATECIDETQEWIFDTCYSRKNRLLQAAISNKHAGIKGMPVLTQGEKELVMRILLEIKGKSTKKHEEAHRTGKLQLCKAPLRYGRQADPIEARSGSLTDWISAPAADVNFSHRFQNIVRDLLSRLQRAEVHQRFEASKFDTVFKPKMRSLHNSHFGNKLVVHLWI